MSQAAEAEIVGALLRAGLVDTAEVRLEPLTGGVSCDVWKVETAKGPIVVKQPLPQLRVSATWFAPVERGQSEVRWLRRAFGINPQMVPQILAELDVGHAFAMVFLPDAPVWKDELIAGRVDSGFAAAVGSSLASVHAATACRDEDRRAFPTDAMFRDLRIDPFLLHVARQDAEVAPVLTELAAQLGDRKMALVHGDVSPKNILVHGAQPIFLDAECAVYGDPAFDLAFCVTHLLLKAVWFEDERLIEAADAMVAAYLSAADWEPRHRLLDRAGLLVAALLLARVDGKSPAPYIQNNDIKTTIRRASRALLLKPKPLDGLISGWKRDAR